MKEKEYIPSSESFPSAEWHAILNKTLQTWVKHHETWWINCLMLLMVGM